VGILAITEGTLIVGAGVGCADDLTDFTDNDGEGNGDCVIVDDLNVGRTVVVLLGALVGLGGRVGCWENAESGFVEDENVDVDDDDDDDDENLALRVGIIVEISDGVTEGICDANNGSTVDREDKKSFIDGNTVGY
jgi:hypothetical protein